MSETSEIERIRKAEDHNYGVSRDALGTTVELADDCVHLYDLLPTLLTAVSRNASDDELTAHLVALAFCGACRYQLTMSTLSVLRGHATDSTVFLRRAVELCAFGALVKRHPHKATVWLKAGNDEKAYKVYQEKFTSKSLFPNNEPVLRALWKRYDFCSKVLHSSIHGMSRNLKFETSEAYFNYFDTEGPDDPILVSSFYYLID